MSRTAICLFEQSGVFADLFSQNGFNVVAIDKKLGSDIFDFEYKLVPKADIIISHPPCTEFAGSGSRWWAEKDKSEPSKLLLARAMVYRALEIIYFHQPRIWWVENPVGRIESCVPELKRYFKYLYNPYEFAGWADDPTSEAYTKKTCLWGKFRLPDKKPVFPIHGSMMHKLPPSPERNELRSKTPQGFARAFVAKNLTGEIPEQKKLFSL